MAVSAKAYRGRTVVCMTSSPCEFKRLLIQRFGVRHEVLFAIPRPAEVLLYPSLRRYAVRHRLCVVQTSGRWTIRMRVPTLEHRHEITVAYATALGPSGSMPLRG